MMRNWVKKSMRLLDSERRRSADTSLHLLDIPSLENVGIDLYLKDESTHPSGSLKHRLARSLFIHAICSGKIKEGTPIVEASSGSTAVSEAYFSRLLGLPFTAVMPASTARRKVEIIEKLGGSCYFVDKSAEIYEVARKLSCKLGGYYMDQFSHAESSTDWRGSNNIAESIFGQMVMERHTVPHAIVMSAGTGGTTATIGRYIRYCGYETRLVVVDPESSVYYESYKHRDLSLTTDTSSRIEGIGRPKVEPSFLHDVIDEVLKVPDDASIAAIHWLDKRLGLRAGGSTGTNLWGALTIAQRMRSEGLQGSIVTIMCDSGERYMDTYYDAGWIETQFGSLAQPTEWLNMFL